MFVHSLALPEALLSPTGLAVIAFATMVNIKLALGTRPPEDMRVEVWGLVSRVLSFVVPIALGVATDGTLVGSAMRLFIVALVVGHPDYRKDPLLAIPAWSTVVSFLLLLSKAVY